MTSLATAVPTMAPKAGTKALLHEAEQAEKAGNAQIAIQAYTRAIEVDAKDGNSVASA